MYLYMVGCVPKPSIVDALVQIFLSLLRSYFVQR